MLNCEPEHPKLPALACDQRKYQGVLMRHIGDVDPLTGKREVYGAEYGVACTDEPRFWAVHPDRPGVRHEFLCARHARGLVSPFSDEGREGEDAHEAGTRTVRIAEGY